MILMVNTDDIMEEAKLTYETQKLKDFSLTTKILSVLTGEIF